MKDRSGGDLSGMLFECWYSSFYSCVRIWWRASIRFSEIWFGARESRG